MCPLNKQKHLLSDEHLFLNITQVTENTKDKKNKTKFGYKAINMALNYKKYKKINNMKNGGL